MLLRVKLVGLALMRLFQLLGKPMSVVLLVVVVEPGGPVVLVDGEVVGGAPVRSPYWTPRPLVET